MSVVKIEKSIASSAYYDVIVAGGGVAGVAAAVSARRHGKKVLLIEKYQKLGGLATTGIVNLFVPMCNGRGKQIIKGMAEEFLRLSIKYSYDNLDDIWKLGEPTGNIPQNPARYRTRFSAEIFALVLTELICNEGIEILFDTIVTEPVMNNGHCKGLIVENKSGTSYYEAGIVVDVTGDSDILYRAGVPTVQGHNYFTYYGQQITLETCKNAIESGNIQQAVKYIHGGTANLYGKNHPNNMPYFTGTDCGDINKYIIENQLLLLNNIKSQDRFSRDIVTLPGMGQFRTTRRIQGDYTLNESDVYRHFDDSIAAICDFDRRDFLYEIPYRTMVCSEFDNLITAGRTISAEGYAWDVTRVIPPAIITGQAAGIAAAMALDCNCPISKIDIADLQQHLSSESVMIHFDDNLIDKTVFGNSLAENQEEIF